MNKVLFGLATISLAFIGCNSTPEDPNLFGGVTAFPFECRSLTKRTGEEWDKRCSYVGVSQRSINDSAIAGVRIGTGLGMADLAYSVPTTPGTARYHGAYLDATNRKLYVGGSFSDTRAVGGNPELKNYGSIFEIDVNFSSATAGNKRLVSGKILTAQGDQDVGTGDVLRTVKQIKKFNGFFYTFSMDSGTPATIMKIDPATGNRTTIWTEKTIAFNSPDPFPADQCENGQVPSSPQSAARKSVQIYGIGNPFEMNSSTGDFYLSIIHTSNLGGPYGIIKISNDGTTCTWVTRFKATGTNKYSDSTSSSAVGYGLPNGVGPRGTGFSSMTLNSNNLYYRNVNGTNWLYASSGSSYWRTNIDNGNRELVVQSDVGDTNSFYDQSRNVLWTTGLGSGTVIVPVFLNETPVRVGDNLRCLGTANGVPCMKGPGYVAPMLRGGAVLDPLDNNLIFAHDMVGIVRYEISTGNTYIVSL